ncbi:MAG: thrombospondin type 3 repeat-containing protein [Myxococcales bacterium]|nr:thrombospondin type 3 repeat-containing protein [Myxococcales bacterium]
MWWLLWFASLSGCSRPQAPEEPEPEDTEPSETDREECHEATASTPSDLDEDGVVDGCDQDVDGDRVPNEHDPAPWDPDWPGTALPDSVYAHSATVLYRLDVVKEELEQIGTFGNSGDLVTDLAIDRFGVLYAMSFGDLYICHPQTAACEWLASLPSSSNGLTFVPRGILESDRDSLVAIAISGSWTLMTLQDGRVTTRPVGGYGGPASSGDAYSIEGVGTYASVDGNGLRDRIVEVDPASGEILRTVATVPYNSLYGMAGWEEVIFGFDESGAVITVDPETGAYAELDTFDVAWWGAGVRTTIIGNVLE